MYLVSTKLVFVLDDDYAIKIHSDSSLYNVIAVNVGRCNFEVKISYYIQFAAKDGYKCKSTTLCLLFCI